MDKTRDRYKISILVDYFRKRKIFLLLLFLGSASIFSVTSLILHQLDVNIEPARTFSSFLLASELWARGPSTYLLVTFLFVWAWLPITFLLLRKRIPKDITYEKLFGSINIRFVNKRVLLISILFLVVFLKLYPYLRNSYPVGIDTPYYIVNLRLVETNPGLVAFDHFIWSFAAYELTFFPLSLLRFVGISWEVIVILFQVVGAVLYVLANYWFMSQNTNDVLGIIATILVALSLSTQDLTSVYYRNTVGLSVMIVFLGLYLRGIKNHRLSDFIFGSICIIFLSIQYQPMVLLLLLILPLFILITALSRDRTLPIMNLIMYTLKFFVPILLLFSIAAFVIFIRTGTLQGSTFDYPIYIFTLYFRIGVANLLPSTWITLFNRSWFSNFVDNPLLLLLSVIGLLTLTLLPLDTKRQPFKNLLLSWFIAISLLFMFIDPQGELYRMVLNIPFGLTAAFGLILISKLRISIGISRSKTT